MLPCLGERRRLRMAPPASMRAMVRCCGDREDDVDGAVGEEDRQLGFHGGEVAGLDLDAAVGGDAVPSRRLGAGDVDDVAVEGVLEQVAGLGVELLELRVEGFFGERADVGGHGGSRENVCARYGGSVR